MVYLVTYDLNTPGKNYERLWDALKGYDYIRDTGLDSVWFVSTSRTAEQISNDLRAHIDASDRLFIVRVFQGMYDGWLYKDIWPWIVARL